MDFDLLNDKKKTQLLYETLGGAWSEIEKLYDDVKTAIEVGEVQRKVSDICLNIKHILSDIESKNQLTKQHRANIRTQINSSKAWSLAKSNGVDIIKDQIQKDLCDQLILKFKSVGLWLVPYGELESFDKSIGRNNNSWIAKVLEKDLAKSSDVERARLFVSEIITSLKT